MHKNIIFYGPPGTGKTYNTINRALEILDPPFFQQHSENRQVLNERFNSLRAKGRIGFVTFHQSFSYEEFVEGLKAETDEPGQINYKIEDGIFKRMCDSAAAQVTRHSEKSVDLRGKRIWKMSLGEAQGSDAYIYEECIENNYILLGYGSDIDFSGASTKKEIQKRYQEDGLDYKGNDYNVTSVNTFVNTMKVGDLVVISDGNLKFRAIGEITGKYRIQDRDDQLGYRQCREVNWLRVYSPSVPREELMDKAFSQMTLYELKPGSINMDKLAVCYPSVPLSSKPFQAGEYINKYIIESVGTEVLKLRKPNGSAIDFSWELLNELARLVKENIITIDDIRDSNVFNKTDTDLEKYIVNGYNNILAPLVKKLVTTDSGEDQNPFANNNRVLIIDEINRGNIAKIFGELITLIEPDKRAGQAEALSATLPYSKNDLTVPDNLYIIGTMNTADRSLTSIDAALRRRFHFEEIVPDSTLLHGVDVDGINIAKLLEVLNQRIEILLGHEYLVGHSYFLSLKNDPSIKHLGSIFTHQIIPLLKEYFFDDWDKIHRALGDHQKPRKNQIIRQRFNETQVSALMGEDWQGTIEAAWEVNEEALNEIDTYKGIYEPVTGT